jgi:GT2 family glycosyltransferase
MLPKVFIITLNWNSYIETKDCLKSLKKVTYPNFQVVVVDNASKDDSFQNLKKEFPPYHFLQSKENLGFTGGNNLGIRYALKNKADYVLLLNNDTIVDSNFLGPLVSAAEKDKKVGLVGGKIYYFEEKDKIWSFGGKINWIKGIANSYGYKKIVREDFSKPKELDFISGCLSLIKASVFDTVGYLDEDYFFHTEDVDFCLRLKKHGFKLIFQPESIIYHKISRSIQNYPQWLIYYVYRNPIIFARKHYNPIFLSLFYSCLLLSIVKNSFAYFILQDHSRIWFFRALKDSFFPKKWGKCELQID